MPEFFTQQMPEEITLWLEGHDWAYSMVGLSVLLITAWLLNFVTKRVLVRGLLNLLDKSSRERQEHTEKHQQRLAFHRFGFIGRLSHVVPALVITLGIGLVPNLPEVLVTVVVNVGNAFIVLTIALALGSMMDVVNDLYQRRPDAMDRPIKGYIQVLKIVVYSIAVLLVIATLLDRSPTILLSGLGALAAVLLLVFQDTILSLVASVQITSNDMIRVGDWIQIPELDADGDVVDIALHIVKVQNWDKTITTIPTRRFISGSFKNWRGMVETGGRRIKRSVYLDQHSVHFLSTEEIERLGRFSLLQDYLKEKHQELEDWNTRLEEKGKEPVNTRRMTNVGTFRAYMVNYLRSSERVRQDLTMIVRHLNPGPEGLPIEIYCFTNTTQWVEYEGIQSDIFDHILAILPEFGLHVFQKPSGFDLREVIQDYARHSADRDDEEPGSLKDTPEGRPGEDGGEDGGEERNPAETAGAGKTENSKKDVPEQAPQDQAPQQSDKQETKT